MKNPKLLFSLIFFTSLLFVGLSIYDDYGVHWDEYHNQKFGHKWYDYSLISIEAKKPLNIDANKHDRIHGPFFEISLI